MSPAPITQAEKIKDFLFLRARLLNAQRSPGFGHENGIIGTEHQTKDLHLELSLRICSCARHTVKYPKKEQGDGLHRWAGGTFLRSLRKVPRAHSRSGCVLQELGWKYT
jgi:hypothetical protein